MKIESVTPFKDTCQLRQQVIAACLEMRDRLGYFVGTWGNISVRTEDGLLVTPTRVSYEKLKPDDLVTVSWEGAVINSSRVPTSEVWMHLQLMLRRPDFGALIHSHCPYASAVACAHRSLPVISDDMAEVIGGEVNCAKFVPASKHKELAQSVCQAIGKESFAVLLANHGLVAAGRDIAEAVVATQFVEKAEWIGYGIDYHLGIDGISLFLVILTTFLMPLVIVRSNLN